MVWSSHRACFSPYVQYLPSMVGPKVVRFGVVGDVHGGCGGGLYERNRHPGAFADGAHAVADSRTYVN